MAASPICLSIVAAIADNGVIGREGRLPWRLGSDLRRFRALTMGHPLIMGRKTFESIGKPLDGRDSIVVTRSDSLTKQVNTVFVAASLEGAIAIAIGSAKKRGVQEIFIIGGAGLFSQALPLVNRAYLTEVHGSPAGDVFWQPEFGNGWVEHSRQERPASPKDEFPVTDIVLKRVEGA